MATITEDQKRSNQELINNLMKALGIDDIEQVRDFSIHVKQNLAIEVEVHAWNTEYQIEKITRIFQSVKDNDKETYPVSFEEKPIYVKKEGEAEMHSHANLPTDHELRKVLYHDKIYNNIYCKEEEPKFDPKGIVVRCSGDLIMGAAVGNDYGTRDDLILENLKGIKEIITYYKEQEPEFPANELEDERGYR